jgi:hypothetical protein
MATQIKKGMRSVGYLHSGFRKKAHRKRIDPEGKGAYSCDQLEHASNTIDSMKAIANAAIVSAARETK